MGTGLRAALDLASPSGSLLSTLVVNLSGALLLGLIAGGLSRSWPAWLHTGITTGLLGGFTTYSALSLWVAQRGVDVTGLLIGAAVAVLGVLAALTGMEIGARLQRIPSRRSQDGPA